MSATSKPSDYLIWIDLEMTGLNPAHELLQLARKMDWGGFEAVFADGYSADGVVGPTNVHVAGQRDARAPQRVAVSRVERRRRRSAVEPKIGHLKSDHRMDRCFLGGLTGDAIKAVLAAAGSNRQARCVTAR